MKTNQIMLLFSILMLFSCLNKQESENNEVPKALKGDGVSMGVLSKRSYDNLLEKLYEELVKQTPELNDLEIKIKALEESEVDSIESFTSYNGKSQRYYNNANGQIADIRDSVLRERIKEMISKSASKYEGSILKQTALLKEIDAKKGSLNDLHITLKIIKTLPLIEKYQTTARPSSDRALNGFIKEINKTITLADTLVRK